MRDETIEQFADVLQNIEFAILCVYREETGLLDLDVIDALDALVRRYAAEEGKRTPPMLRLSRPAALVFEAAEGMCEWRLGRSALNPDEPDLVIPQDQRNSVADILACLKRVRKSVHIWNEQAGRQGYLDYISEFLWANAAWRTAGRAVFDVARWDTSVGCVAGFGPTRHSRAETMAVTSAGNVRVFPGRRGSEPPASTTCTRCWFGKRTFRRRTLEWQVSGQAARTPRSLRWRGSSWR
jgi:hypothetical protein